MTYECSADAATTTIIKRKKFRSEKAKCAPAWTEIGKAATLSELPFVVRRYEGERDALGI